MSCCNMDCKHCKIVDQCRGVEYDTPSSFIEEPMFVFPNQTFYDKVKLGEDLKDIVIIEVKYL